jgi:hypothetical protein
MKIIQDRLGVPVLQEDDGTIVNVTWTEQENLIGLEMMEPGLVDQLRDHIKQMVAQYIPLDPNLDFEDWMGRFNETLTISEFQTALHVLSQVKMRAQEYAAYNEVEEPHDHTG